jgi:ribosome-associated heat shock protein Hsp15
MPEVAGEQRVDKWLWCARFFKSRTLAAKACHEGRIRVSGQALTKAHHALKVGDVLTFPLGPNIRVVRVLALAMRRGPPAEARTLYQDLAPAGQALPTSVAAGNRRAENAGPGADGDERPQGDSSDKG